MKRKTSIERPSWPKILSRSLPSGNTQWRIDTVISGSRIYESFKSESDACTRAWQLNRERQKKGEVAFNLSVEDRVVAARCLEKLNPYGVTLEEATDYYIQHVARFREAPNVKELVQRILDQATTNGRSPNTVIDLRHRLGVFADVFGDRKLAEISLEELEQWASAIHLSPRSRCHALTKASQLYQYARKHGWVADNLIAKLTRPDVRTGIPHHLTVEQSAKLLQTASSCELLPFVVLGLFAGIRPDEIRRLTWDKVKLDSKVIILGSDATKTGQHRVVELHPTALAWLRTCAKKTGRVVDMPEITFKRTWKKLRADAGFKKWGHDDMRHTAATYQCALTGDYAKVAADLGHDVRVLHRHYRGLATKDEAERFFKLIPGKIGSDKIIAIQSAGDTETVAEAAGTVVPLEAGANG